MQPGSGKYNYAMNSWMQALVIQCLFPTLQYVVNCFKLHQDGIICVVDLGCFYGANAFNVANIISISFFTNIISYSIRNSIFFQWSSNKWFQCSFPTTSTFGPNVWWNSKHWCMFFSFEFKSTKYLWIQCSIATTYFEFWKRDKRNGSGD